MNTYFKLTDFFRVQQSNGWKQMPTPKRHILNQITENHYIPINLVRENVGKALKVTRCYATKEYEYSKGRDGTSQHCFGEHQFGEKLGACDVDFWHDSHELRNNYIRLAKELANSQYKRICWYPSLTFFHNDYKANARQFFIYDDATEKWKYITKKDEWLLRIKESF